MTPQAYRYIYNTRTIVYLVCGVALIMHARMYLQSLVVLGMYAVVTAAEWATIAYLRCRMGPWQIGSVFGVAMRSR